jgi:glycerophosphoryl diester phosphodiesterase
MESAADNFPVCITARATRIRAGAPQRFSYLLCWMVVLVVFVAYAGDAVAETPSEATRRHEQIAQRRTGIDIICHLGTSEYAHENTLEAYRATFELGGDGNEIDIRSTRDGELIVFHDDTLDQLLEAFGDVSDFSLDELRQFRFRIPGPFGQQCRIPTLTEVFELHHRYAGLMHLDIKRPGLDGAIADLLTRMDMWDHVAYCNEENSGVILCDARLKLRRYKAPGLYIDHSDVFPNAVAEALKRPGDGIIVDDPRAVALVLGRTFGELSRHPVSRSSVVERVEDKKPISEAGLIMILRDADDWNRVAETTAEKAASGGRITARARAAEQLGVRQASTAEAFAVLEERVRNRSFHKDWKFHGLDGAMAMRSLMILHAPRAIETARFVLWRDDPALDSVIDPRWKNPRAWTDFRVKMAIWPALARCPGPASEKLCREYLALTDEAAQIIGPPQFEQAAKAWLAISPRTATALELTRHRLQVVRGRAILDCLAHDDETWGHTALKNGAPHALPLRVSD